MTSELLSPVERIISGKFGDAGLKVYSLIDGRRTAKEIMKQTKVSESKLLSMVDFMNFQGLVTLGPKKG